MRGKDKVRGSLFSYVDLRPRIRPDHPLRTIRTIVNAALADRSAEFDALHSPTGRDSIPPERLLRALLLQAFYSIPSDASWSSGWTSTSCSVGWAGSVWPTRSGTPPPLPRAAAGCRRARWQRASWPPCWLCLMGHALMENRNGLIVSAVATRALGHAERLAALHAPSRLCPPPASASRRRSAGPRPRRIAQGPAPRAAQNRLAVHPRHGRIQPGPLAEAAWRGGVMPEDRPLDADQGEDASHLTRRRRLRSQTTSKKGLRSHIRQAFQQPARTAPRVLPGVAPRLIAALSS